MCVVACVYLQSEKRLERKWVHDCESVCVCVCVCVCVYSMCAHIKVSLRAHCWLQKDSSEVLIMLLLNLAPEKESDPGWSL